MKKMLAALCCLFIFVSGASAQMEIKSGRLSPAIKSWQHCGKIFYRQPSSKKDIRLIFGAGAAGALLGGSIVLTRRLGARWNNIALAGGAGALTAATVPPLLFSNKESSYYGYRHIASLAASSALAVLAGAVIPQWIARKKTAVSKTLIYPAAFIGLWSAALVSLGTAYFLE